MTAAKTKAKPRKDIMLGVRLTPELQKSTRELAQRDGRSMSNFVRQLLVKAVAQHDAEVGRAPTANSVQHF